MAVRAKAAIGASLPKKITRSMGSLRFPAINLSTDSPQDSKWTYCSGHQGAASPTCEVRIRHLTAGSRNLAKLDSRAGFGERCRGRLLHEIVKDGNGSHSNNAGDNARDDKYTHHVSPVSRSSSKLFQIASLVKRIKSRPRLAIHAGKANASVSTSMKVRPSAPTQA
jgi:hypothetical protein